MKSCDAIIEELKKRIAEYGGWLYFKGSMGADAVPPPDCCNLEKIFNEIRTLCQSQTGITEYLCLNIKEMHDFLRGRAEDVVQRCWEKYTNKVCYHLPFITHKGLPELVGTLNELSVVSAVVKTLDNKYAIIDIQGDTVCIGVE